MDVCAWLYVRENTYYTKDPRQFLGKSIQRDPDMDSERASE